jgi:hypothetical protein
MTEEGKNLTGSKNNNNDQANDDSKSPSRKGGAENQSSVDEQYDK